MIHPHPSDPSDAFELSLREEDAAEVAGKWREGVALAILDGGCLSYRSTAGDLVAIFGVSDLGTELSPWLLCSPLAAVHKASIWRHAKRHVQAMQAAARGRLVYNYIPKQSLRNREFVKALGFSILPSPCDGFDLFYLPPCASQ